MGGQSRGIGVSASRALISFLKTHGKFPSDKKKKKKSETGGISLAEMFISLCLAFLSPSGNEWQKGVSWWSLLKREPKVLNSPDEL